MDQAVLQEALARLTNPENPDFIGFPLDIDAAAVNFADLLDIHAYEAVDNAGNALSFAQRDAFITSFVAQLGVLPMPPTPADAALAFVTAWRDYWLGAQFETTPNFPAGGGGGPNSNRLPRYIAECEELVGFFPSDGTYPEAPGLGIGTSADALLSVESTLVGSADGPFQGSSCILVVPDDAFFVGIGAVVPCSPYTTYTWSVYAHGYDSIPASFRLCVGAAEASAYGAPCQMDGTWQRFSIAFYTGAATFVKLTTTGWVDTGPYYIDGWQLDPGDNLTEFVLPNDASHNSYNIWDLNNANGAGLAVSYGGLGPYYNFNTLEDEVVSHGDPPSLNVISGGVEEPGSLVTSLYFGLSAGFTSYVAVNDGSVIPANGFLRINPGEANEETVSFHFHGLGDSLIQPDNFNYGVPWAYSHDAGEPVWFISAPPEVALPQVAFPEVPPPDSSHGWQYIISMWVRTTTLVAFKAIFSIPGYLEEEATFTQDTADTWIHHSYLVEGPVYGDWPEPREPMSVKLLFEEPGTFWIDTLMMAPAMPQLFEEDGTYDPSNTLPWVPGTIESVGGGWAEVESSIVTEVYTDTAVADLTAEFTTLSLDGAAKAEALATIMHNHTLSDIECTITGYDGDGNPLTDVAGIT